MGHSDLLKRITTRPDVFNGAPIIRGTRVLVSSVLSRLADGESLDQLVADFATITREDIFACIAFGAAAVVESNFKPGGGVAA